MKVSVQPFDNSAALQEGINRLRILVYPHQRQSTDIERHSSLWCWLESHPLADEMHRWVLVTEEGEVVGHLAAMPQYYRINGQRVVAHTPADYQVLPKYGFQALSLMRRFFRATQNCVAVDMLPAVIAVERRLGAEEAGTMQYAAKLLDVSKLPMPPIPQPIRRFLNLKEQSAPVYVDRPEVEPLDVREHVEPPPLRPRVPIPAPVKGLLNGGLRAMDATLARGVGDDLEVEKLETFDESFDEFFERIAAVVPCLPEKNAAFLRWRYGPGSPVGAVTVLGVRGREGLLGYAVLKVTLDELDGYPLDLVVLPGRYDVVRALLRETVRHFRQVGARIIRYRFLESPISPRSSDLRRLGFFPRSKERRNVLLVKFADPNLHKVAQDIGNWAYSIGDGEATFWIN